jgi:hypothetical protein
MSGAFEQYRKSGALATLSHRNMLENCYSLRDLSLPELLICVVELDRAIDESQAADVRGALET